MKPLFCLLFVGLAVLAATPVPADKSSRAPLETAGAYLAAIEGSDLDAAEALFGTESVIFETGGVEGTWSEYRAHHIGAELDAIESFRISRAQPTERTSDDGTMAFVAWPIEYTIELDDGRVIESRGTVTFVLESHGHDYLIRHLHWSSRKKPTAAQE